MDEATLRRLNALNREFYRTAGDDFDRTRGKPWPGWTRILPYLRRDVPVLTVLDVGCGNGRFGVFLAEALTSHFPRQEFSPRPEGEGPGVRAHLRYHGLDSDPVLLAKARERLASVGAKHASPLQIRVDARLEQRDIVEAPPDTGLYTLVALFGVLHHIPGAANRLDLLRTLAARVAPGGLLAFSCWRFYEYERFRARIVPWPEELAGQVEAGDVLLDWRRGNRALRYCHYVDDAEHAALVAAAGLIEVESYRADGQTGDSNRYSLLRRSSA